MRALEVKPGSIDLFANDLKGEGAAGMACFIDGCPTVLYKPDSFARLEIASRNGWGCCKVLAHEIGHHVWRRKRGDGRWGKSNWEGELAADYYAGFAMARLGAGVEDIDDYFTWYFAPDGTEDHPDTVLRMRALRRGFIDGGGEGSSSLAAVMIGSTPDAASKRVLKLHSSGTSGPSPATTA